MATSSAEGYTFLLQISVEILNFCREVHLFYVDLCRNLQRVESSLRGGGTCSGTFQLSLGPCWDLRSGCVTFSVRPFLTHIALLSLLIINNDELCERMPKS